MVKPAPTHPNQSHADLAMAKFAKWWPPQPAAPLSRLQWRAIGLLVAVAFSATFWAILAYRAIF